MRFLTAGESHGPQLTGIVEGLPSQLPLTVEDINPWLKKRQGGYGRGRRMVIETDTVEFMSGVRAGRTTGAPVTLVIKNSDYRNWVEIMDPAPGNEPRKKALTAARPGHADLAGGVKYGHKDLRDVLERASARETAMRVAIGAIAHKLLSFFGVESASFVDGMAGVWSQVPFDWSLKERIEASPVRMTDPQAEAEVIRRIDEAKAAGDTLGGIIEARFKGLVMGLGSQMHWERKLDGRIAQMVMSIPAIKGVEIGPGFSNAMKPGSQVHDPIYWEEGRGYYRQSNRSGGTEAGMTTGEELVVRAALKPIATLMKPLPTVDVVTHQPADAARERSDVTAAPAASVILEALVGIVLAQAYLEKFGGDTLDELVERVERYKQRVLAY
ncbi:chorismate synthase [Meiothermus taiwanensis]|jgi:chorismate synthase|uniref:Chorismate synthase n=2 Tax=Meiothermus taiwanensis TaxID=172827 RepID=A0A399DU83_9DEIN|nr:chorismate synthase [Meiothermus taiwanensis]AWR87576.1 chorismate synthase [Meiothermus taiwanensis WR-220]KIQ54564.1 chorismate synthase [Meiothermus taiwanensis]KZK14819.1 chorismate synthase [Meiothermus taiwanensis]RIH75755.1 Chorismate synthase [Meiothermus taiwanensis]